MTHRHACQAIVSVALLLTGSLQAQPKPASQGEITKELQNLRAVPDAQRGARTAEIALQIRALPAGMDKVKLADGLVHLSTEGDPGHEALQAVATTLATALTETPLPPAKSGKPAMPYFDLAKLARFENVTTDFSGPELKQADDVLAANQAEIEKADFTLKDLKGKKVTLSELRGKIVLVNFWATWCPPCRKEMPDLDAINEHFKSQLVVLSISDEDAFKVNGFISPAGYRPTVLLDPGRKVAAQFHVDGIPQSFVFDAQGKLVAQSIDMRTQRQFLAMLAKAGLHP